MFPAGRVSEFFSGTDWLVSSKHYEATSLHSHSLSNQCKLSCTSPYIQYTISWSSSLSHSYWAQTFNFDTLRAQGPCTWAAGDYKHVCLATRGKKKQKQKRNIHNRKLCLSFLWVFWYDNCYAFKYNLQQPWAPWDCPYVHLQACKLPRCLQLSETEQGWVTEQWNKYPWGDQGVQTPWGDWESVEMNEKN